MTLSLQDWHLRYQQQAKWTRDLRDYAFNQAGIENDGKILEVGSGTGVILNDLSNKSKSSIFGIDIDLDSLSFAKKYVDVASLIAADGMSLPFADQYFDISFCHFLLLWVKNPQRVINEMVRVTKSNGFVICLAEPDYGGRVDYPHELSLIGKWQTNSLINQGANPFIGSELLYLYTNSNLVNIEVGVMGGQWKDEGIPYDRELEWDVVESDLSENQEFRARSKEFYLLDKRARENHQRILYVPTFYAIGKVKE